VSVELAVGRELLGYRIEGVLGRGGMAIVYLAEDLRLGRRVALKLLAPRFADDERFGRRLLDESRVAASLDHPNIVPIYEAGEVDGLIFISMRYVEGETLGQRLRTGPLGPAASASIVGQLASALDAAHERGLVHGDVKPSNVLLTPGGREGSDHVYLTDFGLTRPVTAGQELDQPLMGTLAYVAPEHIRGEQVDARADVYSLGCLLYECVAGRPPFERPSDASLLFAHLEDEPPPVEALGDVVERALAKSPDDRFPSCGELAASAQAVLVAERPRRRSLRWVVVAAACVAAVVAAVAVPTAILLGGSGSGSAETGRLLRIDPATQRVTQSVPVGRGAGSVAIGDGRVWVASFADGSLWHLEPGARRARRVPSVGRPSAVTIDQGSAFVASNGGQGLFGGNVTVFDVATAGQRGGVDLPASACSITSGPSGVWVAGCPNIQRLSTENGTPRITQTVTIPFARSLSAANFREALTGMAEGFGSVWAIGDAADRRLWRIDPAHDRIVATIPLGFPPGGVAAGGGSVWVTDELADRLVRIDPQSNRVAGSVQVGRGASGLAYGAGSIWVAESISHSLTRVDPARAAVVAEIAVHAAPRALAIGAGSVWVVGDAR
jgi:streptogramin lyase